MTTAVERSPGVATRAASRGLHIGLWVAQVLAGLAFSAAGTMKLLTPYEQLTQRMAWALHFPPAAVKLIGLSELLGGIGLILPSALRIMPRLTVLAALGLTAVMVGAVGTHVVLHEAGQMMPSLVLGALAAFVAWGRGTRAPITSR